MPYIGNQSTNSYSSMVKQDLTGASGASVTLSHPVANANEVELYINNVRQEPTTSYTTNGTTLSFVNYTVAASDDIYVIFSGKALQTVVPPDGSVSTAKIASSAVDLTSKVTGVLPVANGGSGMTTALAQQWRLTTTTNESTQADVTANWEVNDGVGYGGIGTGLTESSGIFSFPSTGIYFINFNARIVITASDDVANFLLKVTTDNSSYTSVAIASSGNSGSDGNINASSNSHLFNVTNISTHKFKFSTSSFASGTALKGDSTSSETGFTVIKLGA